MSGEAAGSRDDSTGDFLPLWEVMLYSFLVVAMVIFGFFLGAFFDPPFLRETIEAIPVALALLFVLRLQPRPRTPMPMWLRVIFLAMPLPWILLGIVDFPLSSLPGWPLAMFVLLDALAIGFAEEITFRFSLHRLWARYSASTYVVLSALIFGLLHFVGGIEAIIITTLIGASWALARIAGMPIAILVFVHAISAIPVN